MECTEEQAKKKRCPFQRLACTLRCLGPECMAWEPLINSKQGYCKLLGRRQDG